jgi:hypothetical protein
MSVWLADRVAGILERRTSRRGFLTQTALVGSALAVAPADFILRPGTAYAAICRCGNPACGCRSACCDGYTEFCCTMHGSNTCPPGSFAGGWWKADGSSYCNGPRYYIDCHTECQCAGNCTPGGFGFCPECDGLTCGCANGDCNKRATGCVTFRYGQCHQEIACAGRIACRVVTCTPAYLVDNACTNTSMTDNNTAQHHAPCLDAPATVVRAYGFASPTSGGAWFVGPDGGLFAYGGAGFFGSMGGRHLNAPIVAMAGARDGQGYWLLASDGGVFAFGTSRFLGSMGGIPLDAPMTAMAATADGAGYWLVASDGGVFAYGTARFFGSTGGSVLESPIVGIEPSPDGGGYWLVASDGGVFAYGSALFHGSMGGQPLTALIAGIKSTLSGQGYWLWGEDGSVYAFGDAQYLGSYGSLTNPQPPLVAGGVDAFYGFVVPPGSGTYELWAVSSLGPPPTPARYRFPAP